VCIRAFFANWLAYLIGAEFFDHARPDHKRQHERGQRTENRAHRQVIEYVEAGLELCQVICKVEQHVRPFSSWLLVRVMQ